VVYDTRCDVRVCIAVERFMNGGCIGKLEFGLNVFKSPVIRFPVWRAVSEAGA
jgi:hypothetical protein